MGHVLMQNRNGLLVAVRLDEARGTAGRKDALRLIDGRRPRTRRITLGADKAYDVADFNRSSFTNIGEESFWLYGSILNPASKASRTSSEIPPACIFAITCER